MHNSPKPSTIRTPRPVILSLLPVYIAHTGDDASKSMAIAVRDHLVHIIKGHGVPPTSDNPLPSMATLSGDLPYGSADTITDLFQTTFEVYIRERAELLGTNTPNKPVGSIIAIDGDSIAGFHAAVGVDGIVVAQCCDEFTCRLTRLHNDALCISLAANILSKSLACSIAEIFLTTPFEGGRHNRRLQLLHSIQPNVGVLASVLLDASAVAGGSASDAGRVTTVAIGCDHSAVAHKDEIVRHIQTLTPPSGGKYAVMDVGTNTTNSVDYPSYGEHVGRLVASGRADAGVVVCGTGVGIVNSASKVQGVLACLALHPNTAAAASGKYGCNVLALGARTTGVGVALESVTSFLANSPK